MAPNGEDAAPPEPEPIVEARLPRPRPDEPIYTGSLSVRAMPATGMRTPAKH